MVKTDVQLLVHLSQVAARGKRRAGSVARFLLDPWARCAALAEALSQGRYHPGRGKIFRIQDPKPRIIYALPFPDRVVQHYLIAQTLPAIERRMVPQSYACRAGKGTHRCLEQAAALCRTRRHVLRVDFRKFFPCIDLEILRKMLDRTTPLVLRPLRDRFLTPIDVPGAVEPVHFHFPGDDLFTPNNRPHGLPIGSLTSQIWANVYLGAIDHLLASQLGIGSFVRYCDDLLIYHDDPGLLREVLARIAIRAEQLRLRLHPAKSRLYRTADPVPCLGFVLRRRGDGVQIRLRHDNVVRMRRRIATLRALFAAGAVDVWTVGEHIKAWLAHASHGDTRALLDKECERWRFRLTEG